MLTAGAKEWFKDVHSLVAIALFLFMGVTGQSKETILALIIYLFAGLVVKFSHWPSLIVAMAFSIPGANLFL